MGNNEYVIRYPATYKTIILCIAFNSVIVKHQSFKW